MKHYLLSIANGLHTPPCNNSHGKSSHFFNFRFSLFTPLLVLFLLIVGNSPAWGDNITFVGNEIFYFDVASNSGWGHLDAPDADVYLEFSNNGNNNTKSTPAQWEVENSIFKVTVPAGTYNKVRIVRGQKGNPGNIWNSFGWITLETGKNQILNGGSWSTYIESLPEPLSGDYYVFGAGGTNWVTGWTRSVEANKMTITDGVATKTFYNVSGQGLEFKIHKGETQYNNSLLLEEISENNSHLIKRVWKNGTNIDFSISDINVAHKADVTVHFDGEHIWLTAVPSPETIADSEWYIMGSGNVGTEHSLDWGKNTQKSRGNEHKMAIQDGVATITYTGVSGSMRLMTSITMLLHRVVSSAQTRMETII